MSDEFTTGYLSLPQSQDKQLWFHSHIHAIDGEIETSPPDAKSADRRIESMFIVGEKFDLGHKFKLNFSSKINWDVTKKIEGKSSDSITSDNIFKMDINPLISYNISPGFRIFSGISYTYGHPHQKRQDNLLTASNTKFSNSSNTNFQIGFIRQTKKWLGSFYYKHGHESQQKYIKLTSDDSEQEGNSTSQIPSEYGILLMLSAYNQSLEFDISSIQASEGGDKTEDGVSVFDDYLKFRFSTYQNILEQDFRFTLLHKTLSYARNAFMSIETIPASQFAIDYLDSGLYYGMELGYAKDGQSLPEFNAHYKYFSIGLRFGTNFSGKKIAEPLKTKKINSEKKKVLKQ